MQRRSNSRVKTGLARTRRSFFGKITSLFREVRITEDLWEELEMLLIQADVGVQTSLALIDDLRDQVDRGALKQPTEVYAALRAELVSILSQVQREYLRGDRLLDVVLVVGVNGSGKTTSVAKLARYHKDKGQRVILAAADTFRAAAIDQMSIWADRVGVEIVAHQPRADPGAVVFDAIRAAQSRRAHVLIIDTAGRLHTKYNLMRELVKIHGIARKQVHQAPHETLVVLDATTGQNALAQARVFMEAVGVTGVILAKLDSSAKGGMVFAVAGELGLPVLFLATGEGLDDLAEFRPDEFVEGLFAG